MNRRIRAGAVLGVGVALFAAGGCREKGRPDPNIQMAVSHEPDAAAASETTGAGGGGVGGNGGQGTRIPSRLEIPEAVEKAYSGIVLLWKDSTTGKEGKLEVPLGGSASAAVPDSTLTVTADVFLPAFTMTSDVITSSGVEPENPAARIRVMDGGKPLFAGWIFQRFPDVHPFTHPRFSLRLDGGVRKTSA
jgi:hypothetical protein